MDELNMNERLTTLETRLDTILPTLATKADIAELRGEVRTEMGELRGEVRTEMGELRGEVRAELRAEIGKVQTEVGEVRAEMHKIDASIKTWMVGTVVTIIGTMLAAIFGVSQIFKGASTIPSTPAPIIIQVPTSAAKS